MTKRKKGKYQHKDVYLNAAFDIIREKGIDKLTMRRVADHLDVSAMAIYKHYASKDELLKALLEAFIERADVLPQDDLPWQDFIRHVARNMFKALQGEPIWLTLLGAMDVGANAMQVTRDFLLKLTAAGFDLDTAIEAYVTTLQLVMGSVVLHAAMEQRQASLATVLTSLPGTEDTGFATLLTQPQIETGIPLLLGGLEARLAQHCSAQD